MLQLLASDIRRLAREVKHHFVEVDGPGTERPEILV